MDRNNVYGDMGGVNPYLNFNPNLNYNNNLYIPDIPIDLTPQYVTADGHGQKQRDRFEYMFSQIGGATLSGGMVGGLSGLFAGMKEARIKNLTGATSRSQIVTSIAKTGGSYAQSLGVLATFYSIFTVVLAKVRSDDEINTLISATATGLVYKSSAGLKKSIRGGIAGLGISAIYCYLTNTDKVKAMAGLK